MNKHEDNCRREEYEVQFFGYSNTEFFNNVKSVVEENITESVELLKHELEKLKDSSPEIVEEVRNKLIEMYLAASEKPLAKFQEDIKDCIQIPDHVLLPGDEVYQQQQFIGKDSNKLEEEIEVLMQKAKKLKYMEATLKQEVSKNEKTVRDVQIRIHQLEELTKRLKITDTTNTELLDKVALLQQME